MHDSLTLATIHERTGIPSERLRYVIDQKILPGTRDAIEWRPAGRGRARVYTPYESFALACATVLLDSGLRRSAVAACMDILTEHLVPGSRSFDDVPLYQAFAERLTAFLEVGDGQYVRVLGSEDYLKKPLRTEWRRIGTGEEPTGYEPLLTVRIDAAKLRRLLQRGR